MSISSSLNAGVTGLNVNASKLATISDNIANSGTYGYKRADTEFSAIALTPSAGRYTAGGVTATTFRQVDRQGSLTTTSNPMDIAISGRGMLPVTTTSALASVDGNYPFALTTTGSFSPNAEGVLTTNTGLVLMGWPADPDGSIPNQPRDSFAGLVPVNITLNQFAANPTTEVGFGVNLPASATAAGSGGVPLELSMEYFDNLGTTKTLTGVFTPIVPATGQSNQWTLQFIDSATGASPIAEFTVAFDDSQTLGGSLASVTPVSGGTYDPVTGRVSVNFAGGPVEIAVGEPGSNDYMTQMSAQFAPINLTKNGAPTGNLASVEIDENGFVTAVYDSGFSRRIFQVPLADVPNPNGLIAQDNQTFSLSRSAGPMYLWDAGTGPTGSTIGYAREESTTDIAGELTQLIQTQRAYSSNAKIIQTVDEMLQETTNIKR
ncbi:MAG TPA: flagellar hook-basal body complex protein [Paracoccaceae bacterium]|nr:flagellar hook-basal body complex protein [Paracoccaceae bacterium]